MKRIELLVSLFEKRREYYAVDLRHLEDLALMDNRLQNIDLLIRSTPVKKRESHNRRFLRLHIERKLLETKREVYSRRYSSCKNRSVFIENLLETTSQKSFTKTSEEDAISIMRHNLILMYIVYSGHSDEELERMINKSQS
jgi:hypothetical protein